MPVGRGTYRTIKTKHGDTIRLHFTPAGAVNEAKNMKSGAVHTPAEFKADRKKKHKAGPDMNARIRAKVGR